MPSNTEVIDYGSGLNVYGALRSRTTGQFWNGAGMEAYQDAHWSTYAVTMPETGTSGIYLFTAPGALPVDSYDLLVKQRLGGAPALSDSGIWSVSGSWDGGQFLPLSARRNGR
jgi:hypothetical protein